MTPQLVALVSALSPENCAEYVNFSLPPILGLSLGPLWETKYPFTDIGPFIPVPGAPVRRATTLFGG